MCDPLWDMISRRGVLISITNCYIFTFFLPLKVCMKLSKIYLVSKLLIVNRSTQSCIPLGSLSRVPASAGIEAGKSPLPDGR